ncbi:MAG TPA: exodeoxyribonuclease V subunit alpha [Solirubrobacteraceae bacterium]|nr:exodeoxyribonuclease V subunit alpha [Solirubrobacteraceae bacterium]
MSDPAPPPLIPEFDSSLALGAPEPLRAFNGVGVLSAADVHVAQVLAELAGGASAEVQLAVALAVRAPRLGSVFADLASVRDTAAVESEEVVDLSALPWPAVEEWLGAVSSAPQLVAVGEELDHEPLPLRLVGTRLYLDRYWREERSVAGDLSALGDGFASGVSMPLLAAGIGRLFGEDGDLRQACAAACAVLRRLSVIAGGPGTGKTTTVARVAALLYEQALAAGGAPPLVALTAFTGKAAARLEELVHHEARSLDVDPALRAWLLELRAGTIHRLLGTRPGSHTAFRHNRSNGLPHDVVIVDETSMVSLSLMARLLEAVRTDARVVLVGDPGQLTAIEAGAVLRDIVGPASEGLRVSAPMRAALEEAVGRFVVSDPSDAELGDGIVVLERVHRYGEGIARVAEAVRRGDGDGAIAALRAARPAEVVWLPIDVADEDLDIDSALGHVRAGAVAAGRAVLDAAAGGDARAALAALSSFRLLCAHRRGPHGVAAWTAQIERWLVDAAPEFDAGERDYVGRPLLVTRNDYELGLYNGDTGVIVGGARLMAAFERGGVIVSFTPSRLDAVETVYAMTIHKSQGSQFDTACVLLPDPSSRILTRELLYTAVTRARSQLVLIGTEEMVRAAVDRPVARASGLRERLWGS